MDTLAAVLPLQSHHFHDLRRVTIIPLHLTRPYLTLIHLSWLLKSCVVESGWNRFPVSLSDVIATLATSDKCGRVWASPDKSSQCVPQCVCVCVLVISIDGDQSGARSPSRVDQSRSTLQLDPSSTSTTYTTTTSAPSCSSRTNEIAQTVFGNGQSQCSTDFDWRVDDQSGWR